MASPPDPATAKATLENAAAALAGTDTLGRIMDIVRLAVRPLTGADGATFVLREGTNCYYAEEDAIGPLWKGRRFPQTSCLSGWVMMNGQPAVVENVFEDPRIPVDAYRPTFVRSLLIVPVGERMAIAAIGAYWAKPHRAAAEQVKALQSLARYASSAMQRLAV